MDTRTGKVYGYTAERKRLRIVDFSSKAHLSERLLTYIAQWNETAHAFKWSAKSFTKILAKCEQVVDKAA